MQMKIFQSPTYQFWFSEIMICINWQWKWNIQLCFLSEVKLPWCLWSSTSKRTFGLDWPLISFCSEQWAFITFRIFILLWVPGMSESGFSDHCARGSLSPSGTWHNWNGQKGAEACVKRLLHFSELLLPWRCSCLLLQNVFHIFYLVTETIQNQEDVQ